MSDADESSTDTLERNTVLVLGRRGFNEDAVIKQLRAARAELSETAYRIALQFRTDSVLLPWDMCVQAGRVLDNTTLYSSYPLAAAR